LDPVRFARRLDRSVFTRLSGILASMKRILPVFFQASTSRAVVTEFVFLQKLVRVNAFYLRLF